MNRKEMCAAVGVLVGAGCSPAAKSLAVPGGVVQGGSTIPAARSATATPHLSEVLLSLISGTPDDIGSAVFRLLPKSGWSIVSDDPRLHVEIQNGHVAVVSAPEHKTINFIATATVSHTEGEHFNIRCHVEAGCSAADGA
jgi:hypothetical protein